jgi:hypothetical protein
MKYLTLAWLVFAPFLLIQPASAEDMASAAEIPIAEQDFVKSINRFTKDQIIAQFGEPDKADDVKIKGSGKVVASIWLYHYINTSADGDYYQTTELDFIDDKVVMVAFLNNDGTESPEATKEYDIPN